MKFSTDELKAAQLGGLFLHSRSEVVVKAT
jgi:hypothetical protein